MTTKTLHVTAAQVRAARALLADAKRGGEVDERLRLIADTDLETSPEAPVAPAVTTPRRGPAPAQ